jgi:hypothetical protein
MFEGRIRAELVGEEISPSSLVEAAVSAPVPVGPSPSPTTRASLPDAPDSLKGDQR